MNYPIEDSLENWGPDLPGDFARNFESTPQAFART
jgi:hypothetical protein